MSLENRFWQVVNLVAILSTAIVPAYTNIYVANHAPLKRLEANQAFAANVTSGLGSLGSHLTLSMLVEGRPVKNIVSAFMSIQNVGTVPILPSDFYQRLSINVAKPWVLLTIIPNDTSFSSAWHKVTDQRFESDPTLLNPGETIFLNVFLTNPVVENPTPQDTSHVNLYWTAHVLNVSEIEVRQNPIRSAARDMWGVTVMLYGWHLIITICLGCLFMAEYIFLLFEWIRNCKNKAQVILALVGAGLLSISAAESLATYLAPNVLEQLFGIDHKSNFPLIVLNLAVLGILWRRLFQLNNKKVGGPDAPF